MNIMYGQPVVEHLVQNMSDRVATFKELHGRPPALAIVLVGDDPASQIYVNNKIKTLNKLGLGKQEYRLPAETSQIALNEIISNLNQDESVDGILVQFPLPKQLSRFEVLSLLDPLKDVDGLTPQNLGLLFMGMPRVAPCTPSGILEMLKFYKIEMAGKVAVVVGRSEIVGKSVAQLLLRENMTLVVCHSKTKDLRQHTLNGDVVIVAAGKAKLLGSEDFKPGAVVIDVGIHRIEGKIVGDVRADELRTVSGYSPVPKGVGPLTIQMLMQNTVTLAELKYKNL